MKQKLLILQKNISSYNIPLYNYLTEKFEITVGFTHNYESDKDFTFKIIKLKYIRIGSLYFNNDGFYKICSKFDVVIFMPDLHYISYCTLPLKKRKYKVIAWSIGIRASYTKRYNVNRKALFLDKIYGFILNKANANIFYMKEPIKFWGNNIDKDKIFIAHNTVEILSPKIQYFEKKNRILFIGTLYNEKKIHELLDAYIEAKKRNNSESFLYLDIIGKGDEFNKINELINKNKLADYIFLHGAIYDEIKIAEYFSKSILCISPDQAGLSVLKSMGYGVPYITHEDAITGGERLNIITGVNGILYKNKEELITIIIDAFNNPNKYIKMGINAKEYYNNNATIKHMSQGFIDAINFVIK